jgi:hypothetical protein
MIIQDRIAAPQLAIISQLSRHNFFSIRCRSFHKFKTIKVFANVGEVAFIKGLNRVAFAEYFVPVVPEVPLKYLSLPARHLPHRVT